jgi:cell division initiation protein
MIFMKVTPLEIRQKQFEKKTFGGLDKDEVQAYLNSLSLAWEKMTEEHALLRSRLEQAGKEIEKLRVVETSLHGAIRSAQETSQKTIDQADQQAQLIVQDARLKADAILQDAKWKAGKIMEQAEDYTRKSYNEMVGQVKVLEVELRHIEHLKDTFLSEIKLIARDLLDKSEKAEQRSAQVNFSVPPLAVPELTRPNLGENEMEPESESSNKVQHPELPINQPKEELQEEAAEEDVKPAELLAHPKEEKMPESKPAQEPEEGSFFDRI